MDVHRATAGTAGQAALAVPGTAQEEEDRHREWPRISRPTVRVSRRAAVRRAAVRRAAVRRAPVRRFRIRKGIRRAVKRSCFKPYKRGRGTCRRAGRKFCSKKCKAFKGTRPNAACKRRCYPKFKKICFRKVARRAHRCLSRRFGGKKGKKAKKCKKGRKGRKCRRARRARRARRGRRMPDALKAYLRQAGAYAYGLGPHPAQFGMLPYSPFAHVSALAKFGLPLAGFNPAVGAATPYNIFQAGQAPFPLSPQALQQPPQQGPAGGAGAGATTQGSNPYPAPVPQFPQFNPFAAAGTMTAMFHPAFTGNPFAAALPVAPKGKAPIKLDSSL